MFRIILLAAIAPLVIACQSTSSNVDPSPYAEDGQAIAEPTDGIEDEIGVDN